LAILSANALLFAAIILRDIKSNGPPKIKPKMQNGYILYKNNFGKIGIAVCSMANANILVCSIFLKKNKKTVNYNVQILTVHN
jgi:hypothetical protein